MGYGCGLYSRHDLDSSFPIGSPSFVCSFGPDYHGVCRDFGRVFAIKKANYTPAKCPISGPSRAVRLDKDSLNRPPVRSSWYSKFMKEIIEDSVRSRVTWMALLVMAILMFVLAGCPDERSVSNSCNFECANHVRVGFPKP